MTAEDDYLPLELTIRFSRHCRRRMQLYGIDEGDVRALIGRYAQVKDPGPGNREIVDKTLAQKYRYPLKIVYSVQANVITVVTAYPLRKGLD